MIQLRYLIKKDGQKALQYRNIAELQPDNREHHMGYAHFTASEWKDVPIVKEEVQNGRF